MLEHYFSDPNALHRLRTGSSQPYIDDFADSLRRAGYAAESTQKYLNSAAHLGHFLQARKIRIADLESKALEKFLRHIPRCRCALFRARKVDDNTRCAAKHFYEHLIRIGICQPAAVVAQPLPEPVISFRDWYRQHRGVSEQTMVQYLRGATALMEALGPDITQWDAKRVRGFVFDCAKKKGTSSAQQAGTATRAFLRHLIFQGKCRAGLDQAVPAVAHWKLAALPPCLSSDELSRLIAACDGDSPGRLRDRAIILLLARLGLRAGDVAKLRLADIEWQSGTMRVTGKGRFEVRLPLPQEVGDALLRYLECRPAAEPAERIFLRNIAPFRPGVSPLAISSVVKRALKRAGIEAPCKGAHLLRHTAVTEMLRHGVSLDRIGLVLRHRSLSMTASYAKVDTRLLQLVTQPWPEVHA